MPPGADFEQFSTAFLKCCVTPADSAKAQRELPLLKQNRQSVETYAVKFNNNCFIEGLAIESTNGPAHGCLCMLNQSNGVHLLCPVFATQQVKVLQLSELGALAGIDGG